MRLIIREYLALLKESKELDRMLPDLLLMMGIEPLSFAQVGVRQYGVDVAAVGKESEYNNNLLLITIKQGNIGRADWDTNEQSIRQSLEEIKDVYLESYIRPEHKELRKKIIVCTGGSLKQEIEPNWNGYIKKNTIEGKIDYEFWGGDKLAILIEKYMFNEQIVPDMYRSSFRKVLSLLSDTDYNLSDYYTIIEGMLLQTSFDDFSKTSDVKKAKKILRTVNLLMNIIFYWSKNDNNLKPALYISERTILITWEFIRRNNLYKKTSIMKICHDIYKSFFTVYYNYTAKIQKNCYIKNGFHGHSRHAILENLNIYEQLGILSTTGIFFVYQSIMEKNDELFKSARIIMDSLKAFINNHSATTSPFYDDHIIEISEAIYLLSLFSEIEFIDNWIKELLNNIAFAYTNMGKYFPIQSDSFDDLLELTISGSKSKKELSEISTLFPILAQWCAVLDLSESYSMLTDIVKTIFKHTTFQIWYPNEDTENFIYFSHAGYKSGVVDAPCLIPDDINEMKKMIISVNKKVTSFEELSSIKNGLSILPIISSRHFRTPFLPFYWQLEILDKYKKTTTNKD